MNTISQAIESAPEGTSGLVVEPWSKGEIYAVAANWGNASSPVWNYGEDGWQQSGRQVADFRHEPRAALIAELEETLVASGDDPADTEDIIGDATEF